MRDAFVYDWRLWTLPELTRLVCEAKFDRAEVWMDTGDGCYEPTASLDNREDWVAYVIGVR